MCDWREIGRDLGIVRWVGEACNFVTEILGLEDSEWDGSTIELMIHLSEEYLIPNIDASANNLKSTVLQTQHHIWLVTHLHQVLFEVEFRISGAELILGRLTYTFM